MINVRVRMYVGVRCIEIHTAAAQTVQYIDISSVCIYVCYNLVCISMYVYIYVPTL